MPKKAMQFEQAFSRLEKIVEELETGQLTLDDTLKKYEEGTAMLRACRTILEQAEKKIEMLTKDEEGKLKAGPTELEKQRES